MWQLDPPLQVGVLLGASEEARPVLRAGEVGYVVGAIKAVGDARVGLRPPWPAAPKPDEAQAAASCAIA